MTFYVFERSNFVHTDTLEFRVISWFLQLVFNRTWHRHWNAWHISSNATFSFWNLLASSAFKSSISLFKQSRFHFRFIWSLIMRADCESRETRYHLLLFSSVYNKDKLWYQFHIASGFNLKRACWKVFRDFKCMLVDLRRFSQRLDALSWLVEYTYDPCKLYASNRLCGVEQ